MGRGRWNVRDPTIIVQLVRVARSGASLRPLRRYCRFTGTAQADATEGTSLNSDLAQRVGPRLSPDPRRVLGQLFVPGEESAHGRSRAASVLDRLLALDETEVTRTLAALLASFAARHDDF